MRKYEDYCVQCPSEMGCLGNICPNRNVPIDYCDICKNYAIYRIGDDDYCEICAQQYLKDEFNDLALFEQAEVLNIDIREIE